MTDARLRTLFIALIALSALTACSKTKTSIPLSWRNPAYEGGSFKKLFVIGVGRDNGARRLFEDTFAKALANEGTAAQASWGHLPQSEQLSEEQVRGAIEGGGFDGVLVTRLLSVDQDEEYVPPSTHTVPTTYYGYGYYGYYGSSYTVVHEPGYYKTNTTFRLETNLYSVATGDLVWSGQSHSKRDNAWLYLGFQRRVRRLASGQVTDSFLGADIMIEDFEGYNNRIADMNWKYLGTTNVLLPFYNHNDMQLSTEFEEDDGYQFIEFGGKGGCFPNITWQLRKVYIVEADPVDDNHPIAKRVHYVDAQTFTLPRTLIYDRKGDLWKSWTIGQAHPDHHMPKNKGTGVSIDDSFSMIDVQAGHCTTGQFKGQLDPSLNPPSIFTVQNMRATGR